MLQIENKRAVTVCAGVGQTGKSTFGLRLLVNAPLGVRYIFDPESEYTQRLGIPAASTGYELSVQLCQGWVLFDPHTLFPGDMQAACNFFCDWAFETASAIPGEKVLLIDEVWKYQSPQKLSHELATCVQTGRKRGLKMLFNTQLPQKLNVSLRNECSELVCFRLQDESCLDWVKERGFNTDQVKGLPDLHFISRTDTGGELRGQIKI